MKCFKRFERCKCIHTKACTVFNNDVVDPYTGRKHPAFLRGIAGFQPDISMISAVWIHQVSLITRVDRHHCVFIKHGWFGILLLEEIEYFLICSISGASPDFGKKPRSSSCATQALPHTVPSIPGGEETTSVRWWWADKKEIQLPSVNFDPEEKHPFSQMWT